MALLESWLEVEKKDPTRNSVTMWSVSERLVDQEREPPSIAPALADHLIGDEFLAKAARLLPHSNLRSLVESRLPASRQLKRGFFGEVLTAVMLEEFHGSIVPVKKLRSRTSRYNSPTATDVFAIRTDAEGKITNVLYVEVKVRTTRSDLTDLARQAHCQLQADCAEMTPAIIGFVAAVLSERNDPLFDSVMAYLRDREALRLDDHHIALVLEEGLWRESDMGSLIELDDLLDPLEIHLVVLKNLAQRVADDYSKVGCEALADDE